MQCAPDSWVGQIGSRTLTGAGTPTVGPDGSNFNGRNVAHTAISGSKHWRASGLATVLVAGTQPWGYVIGRFVSPVPAITGVLAGIGNTAISDNGTIRCNAGSGVRDCYFNGPIVANGVENFAPHRMKCWKDGTNAHFQVDATDATTPTATALTHNINCVSVGSAANQAANFANARMAFYLLCSAKPSAAEESALDAWAQSYWGVP